jgi:hypothetical protein
MATGRLSFVGDYDLSEAEFHSLLAAGPPVGRLDRDWAAARLIEYAPYDQIGTFLGFGELVRGWPAWRSRVRSATRRRGLDFLVRWVTTERPDLL